MAMQFTERSVRRCHKRKRSSSTGSEADANNDDQVKKEPGGYLCAICLDEIDFEKDWFVQYCPRGHKFHSLCAIPWVERTSRLPSCPVCRGPPRRLTRALLEMDCLRLLGRSMMDSSDDEKYAQESWGLHMWHSDLRPWNGNYVIYCCCVAHNNAIPTAMDRVNMIAPNGSTQSSRAPFFGVLCRECRTFLSEDNHIFAGLPDKHEYPSCEVHGTMTIAIDVRSQSYRFACLRHQIARRDTYPVDCNLPAVHPAGWVVQRDLLRCHVGGSSANLAPLLMQLYL